MFSFNSGISLKNENNIITLHEFKVVAKQFLNNNKLLFEKLSLFKYIYIHYMTQVTLNESLIPRLTKKKMLFMALFIIKMCQLVRSLINW